MTNPQNPSRAALLMFGACLLVALAAFWPGLRGGLLLDDKINLQVLNGYLAGDLRWQAVVFENPSGWLGRSLSMLSFLANAATTGNDLFAMKLTNVVVHLVNGVLMFAFLRELLAHDRSLSRFGADRVAALLAGAWLLLPLHVSTVLYLVQRMTELSATFALLALIAWLRARRRLAAGESGALPAMFAIVPLLALAATLAKENGALVPLYALVLEACWFGFGARGRERRIVFAWFTLFLALPAVAALAMLASRADTMVLGSYATRDFTFGERLLTEPRILWQYVRFILVPDGPRMGLVQDGFPLSRGLLDPPTTLFAIAAWAAALAFGWIAKRRGFPLLFAGPAIFLAGHALESTIFALELYFEHRNYLPSIGILLWVAGLIAAFAARIGDAMPLFARVRVPLVVAVLLVFAGATFARAGVWSDTRLIYEQALRAHPDSPRLQLKLGTAAIEEGRVADAAPHFDALRRLRPQDDPAIALLELLPYCAGGASPPPALYDRAAIADARIRDAEVSAFSALAERVEQRKCAAVDAARLVAIGRGWLDANRLRDSVVNTWKTRYFVARLLASRGEMDAALAEATRAWRDAGEIAPGVLVFQLNASAGRVEECRRVLAELRRQDSGWDRRISRALADFQSWLDARAAG